MIQAIEKLQNILNAILPFLVSLGVLYFIWGVIRYVIAGGEEAKKKGRDQIIYGVIGLAVIISVWGLVGLLTSFIGTAAAPDVSGLTVAQNSTTSGLGCEGILGTNAKFQNYLSYITCIINDSIIPFIFALAIVMFVWGAVKFFIINSGEEAKREQGKQFMLWGVIALAVMVSVWGLVGILRSTFGFTGGSVLPQVRPNGSP